MGKQVIKPFPIVEGLQTVSPNALESLILNGWKPQLAVTGIDGLPILSKAGNVMLPYTSAKLSIRIPPTKNPEEAKQLIIKTLTTNPPYNAKVTISDTGVGGGFNAPAFSEPLEKAIEEASQSYFGKGFLNISEGMSIPFMGFLNEHWPKTQFIITGVLGPGSNAHGPNEFLHIPYAKKLTCSMAYILAKTVGRL